jgi:hypothetical protein
MTAAAPTVTHSQLNRRANAIRVMDAVERMARTQPNLHTAYLVWQTLRQEDNGRGAAYIGLHGWTNIPKGEGLFWQESDKEPGLLYLKNPSAVRRALENFLSTQVQKVQESTHV